MAINPNNGVLDIIGTLKVSSIDVRYAGGFTTAINNIARNDVLLYDDQKATTTFTPNALGGYISVTGVTRDTTEGAGYLELSTASEGGWVYWPLQLPNSWHADFDIHITATGGVLTFSLFNTSEPNHTDYTADDGGYKIVFDNTQNKIDIRWRGSVHATTPANLRSTEWQHVNINYFQGEVSLSIAGKVVLTHEFTENYQELDSRYVGFSATAGVSHKIRHLRVHNSDKWLYTKTSNASDITYVSGNVGIGTLEPTELLDVHGNVHIAKDLTVDGNLTVSGTTTFIDTTNMSIEDPIVELAKGNASDTIDAGLIITRPTSNVAVAFRGDERELALGYTQSSASSTDVTPIANGGLDVRIYGNVFANNLTTTANVEATYLKGDGSELTHVTLDQVVGYGNVTSNTIQLAGLVATGNVEANYFVGDGSKLTNILKTFQAISDNGNVTSNTIQFTNATTAFVADSNVGIGTRAPAANLHVVGHQYVNDPPTISGSFDHSDAPLTLTHPTPTSSSTLNDPKPVLHLTRDGTNGESYGSKASFKMSRYENSGTASRSRLDVSLTDGTYTDTHVMSLRGDGRVGIGKTNPGQALDVSGNVNAIHFIGDGSFISNVVHDPDFESNVSRIESLEASNADVWSNLIRVSTLESGNMTISGIKTFENDVILESNLHIKGDVLVANTINMVVSDPIIELGSNNLNTGDLGIVMTRHGGTNSNVAIIFDESDDVLRLGYTLGSAYDTSIGMDANLLTMNIRGNLEVSNHVSANSLTINTVYVTTTMGLDEVLNVSNTTTNTIQITNTSGTALDVTGGASVGSNLQVGTANLFVDTTTGRVGVGTSEPMAVLDVQGDILGGCPVYFSARSSLIRYGASNGAIIEFDTILEQRGGGYSTTGVFTCPLAGVYKFDYFVRNTTTSAGYIRIYVNNVYQIGIGTAYILGVSGTMGYASYMKALNVGDTVDLRLFNTTSVGITNQYNGFIGQYISSL